MSYRLKSFTLAAIILEKEIKPSILGCALSPNSTQPFRHFYQFAGLGLDGRNLPVDIDASRHAWGRSVFNSTDIANKWHSTIPESRARKTSVPRFSEFIPWLDSLIANIVSFLHRCEYEPFQRVYNVHGLDGGQAACSGRRAMVEPLGDWVAMRGGLA